MDSAFKLATPPIHFPAAGLLSRALSQWHTATCLPKHLQTRSSPLACGSSSAGWPDAWQHEGSNLKRILLTCGNTVACTCICVNMSIYCVYVSTPSTVRYMYQDHSFGAAEYFRSLGAPVAISLELFRSLHGSGVGLCASAACRIRVRVGCKFPGQRFLATGAPSTPKHLTHVPQLCSTCCRPAAALRLSQQNPMVPSRGIKEKSRIPLLRRDPHQYHFERCFT